MDDSQGRLLNVSLLAGSGAHRAYYDRSGSRVSDLQSVIQQYYDVAISSHMLPSVVLPGSAPATIYKDQVEAVVARHRMAPGAAPAGSVWSQHH